MEARLLGKTARSLPTRRINAVVINKRFATSQAETLQKTPLYDLHKRNGGKFGPFAGFSMPLNYAKGGQQEHVHTRKAVSIFDVSHMVQSRLTGNGATAFLNWLTPSSVSTLKHSPERFSATLSVFLNPSGGILDDLMITRQGDEEYYIVTNAGRRTEDLAWIRQQLEDWNSQKGSQVKFQVLEDKALIAVQGPQACKAMQNFTKIDLNKLYFAQSTNAKVLDVDTHIARSGYTGEDGFEISIPSEKADAFVDRLLQDSTIQLAGLAARDSLRIEAGLCLYGHDITENTTPVEAGLSWVIGKDRRQPDAFIGASSVLAQLSKDGPGPAKRRVGLTVQGAPAREGAKIFDKDGIEIGLVTSGIPSPTLGQNIAMGYVASGSHKKDTPVQVEVRKKMRPATITRMPFVEAQYFRTPSP